jgi:DNA invertase Pin-like site-specific DNA recombinase
VNSVSPVPAAQYLRMSTDHQQYSLRSQTAAIQRYAEIHGFRIVQTYEDAGRSGLSLKRREGLARLLHDVVIGAQPFRTILVYDVSRWGRFQDPDEAAHYEFVCKNAGIPVHYCAEIFTNDGTLPNTIMKALKRAMAGEYSRELSVKIDRAKRIVAELGFRAGGAAGYGLRRMLLSASGTRKGFLKIGEMVNIDNGRVILVPGSQKEVATIREIYRLAISENKNTHAIARELNRRRIKPPGRSSSWTYEPVLEILTNRKYMGDAVYGRTRQVLGSSPLRVPCQRWIVKERAFKPIVDSETFAAAQRVLHDRTIYRSDQELLDRLRTLLKKEGTLTMYQIDKSREVPAVRTFRERFGTMKRAYDLIGHVYPKDAFNLPSVRRLMTKTRRRHDRLRRKLLRGIRQVFVGEAVESKIERSGQPVICFQDGLRMAVITVPHVETPLGKLRWRVPPLRSSGSHVTLLCRCNAMSNDFQDLYLVRSLDQPRRVILRENDEWLKRGKRIADLSKVRRLADSLLREARNGLS